MTTPGIRSVTVYCSSSKEIARQYFDAGAELGAAIARKGWALVYGGNRIGLMAAVADAARAAGGKVVGVTPQLMVDQGIGDDACDELVVTSGMRERKALLEQRADAFIALPGGLGTFEELFEVVVARLLGYHDKPIVVLNTAGYFDPLLAMIEHGIEQRFIKPRAREAYFVATTVTAAMTYLTSAAPGGPGHGPGPLPREPSAME
jgi:uncharacterized protein (TIGR00730 family)